MCLHELANELKMVVSEMGEQWSPRTDPASTHEVTLKKMGNASIELYPEAMQTLQVAGSISGYKMAIVPHDDPVENATNAANKKVRVGINQAGMCPPKSSVKKVAVCKSSVMLAKLHAKIKMTTALSMVLNPAMTEFMLSSRLRIFCETDMPMATIRATMLDQRRA